MRAIERIVIVLIGGASLWMGWQLFLRLQLETQQAELDFNKISVKLQRVGPGIFFAAFGTVLLGLAIYQLPTLKMPSDTIPPSPVNNTLSLTYFGQDVTSDKRTVRALNTVISIDPKNVTYTDGPVVEADFAKALVELQKMRYNLLLSRFSSPQLDTWIKYGSKFSNDPNSAPPEVREDLRRIKPWFDETIVMEPN